MQDSCTTDTIGDLWPKWFDAKVSDNSIEYVRTDVFIEEVSEWIMRHCVDECYLIRDNDGTWVDFDALLYDLKKLYERTVSYESKEKEKGI